MFYVYIEACSQHCARTGLYTILKSFLWIFVKRQIWQPYPGLDVVSRQPRPLGQKDDSGLRQSNSSKLVCIMTVVLTYVHTA